MLLRAFTAAFVLLPALAVSQSAVLQPASTPFNERLVERVPVSGRALVGVVAAPDAGQPQGFGLSTGTLSLLGTPSTAVCVRAATQDGRYVAENAFGPAASGASSALAWPSAYPAALAAVPLREVAVLATLGPCREHAPVLPVVIGPVPAAPFLHVLANTRGAATWAVLRDPASGGPSLRRVRCLRVEGGARVAFDASCPLGALPEAARLELRLEQQGRDGRSLEVVERTAIVPGRGE